MVKLQFASNSNEWRIVRIRLQTVPETLTPGTELTEMQFCFAIAVFTLTLTLTKWDTIFWKISCIVMAPRRPTFIPA